MHMRTPRLARLVIAALLLSLTAGSLAFAQSKEQTASQFYMKYRAAFDKAKTIEEILPYMAKENKAQVEATPAADRAKMFEMVKMMSKLTDVKIVKEERSADGGATLTVTGTDMDKNQSTGKVTIVKESDGWKVGKESWSTKAS
jgi:uncharacterized protein DUF4878